MEQPEEHRPFLELEEGDEEQGTQKNEDPRREFTTRNQLVVVLLLSLLLLAMSTGRLMSLTGLYQQQQEFICRQFLSSNGDNGGYDKACKSPKGETAPEVDHELGVIAYWDFFFSLFPATLVAIPFGLVGDKHGRKKFVVLSSGGIAVSAVFRVLICSLPDLFPLRLVWLASIFTSITGGYVTFFAMVFAIAADISSQKRMFMLFLYLGLFSAVSSLPAGYLSLHISRSASLFVSLALHVFCPCVAAIIPDTHTGVASLSMSDIVANELSYLLNVKALQKEVARILRLVFRDDKRLGALLLALSLVLQLGANGELVLTMETGLSVFWFILILLLFPCYRSLLSTDLWLARIIVLVSLPGAFFVQFAIMSGQMFMLYIGSVVLSISHAYPLVTRSLLVNLGKGRDIAALFSVMGAVQGLVQLLSTPTSVLLSKIGAIGSIIPFVLYTLSVAVLFTIWPKQSDDVDEQRVL